MKAAKLPEFTVGREQTAPTLTASRTVKPGTVTVHISDIAGNIVLSVEGMEKHLVVIAAKAVAAALNKASGG